MNFIKTVSAVLNIPAWRLFYIRRKASDVHGCVTVKFGIIGNGKLKEFQPRNRWRVPTAVPTVPTSIRPTCTRSGAQTNHVMEFVMLSLVLLTAYTNLG